MRNMGQPAEPVDARSCLLPIVSTYKTNGEGEGVDGHFLF
ncbi:Uncharacterized protein APZ42_027408 [Daphnia magna]|uniref:Uncharacterized protein n=1 Tax=Daphnia magna TaxID=35525 RepID=A0A164RIW7_9CRUS|nr:Uncharacterized protein APZ42_027408 [Daphnia magna]